THYLAEIDEGRSENVAAPEIARRYWNLPADATLRDVVLVVRADEAHHRDVNHGFANELAGAAPIPASALGATSVGVSARVARLADRHSAAHRVGARVLLTAITGVAVATPVLAAWAAASGLAACGPFTV
ncbi:MAG: alternative oxidase, partial [Mycobacterium sp.]|nr:alternative oxidase [Mycobacterium sp.]